MPQGLQVWDAQGRLILDVTDRLSRILGQVATGSAAGAIAVPEFAAGYGTPWAFVQQRNASANQFGKRCARVTISGTTLSWDFPGLSSWEILPAVIQYGVY
ncbi:hypothetical protein F3J44_18300 [Pantoea sp. Tr-811]|nr:hypothetical protein [Pantoea sp. Tr-811]